MALELCIILPMTLINNLRVFVRFSIISNIIIIISITYVTFTGLINMFKNGVVIHKWINVINLFEVIGISIYSFENIGVLLALRKDMKD